MPKPKLLRPRFPIDAENVVYLLVPTGQIDNPDDWVYYDAAPSADDLRALRCYGPRRVRKREHQGARAGTVTLASCSNTSHTAEFYIVRVP